MALASAPSTPQRVVPQPSIRRSFTAPIRSSTSKFPISQEILDDSETLFAHSACKIVSFSTSRIFVRRHSIVSNGRPDSQEEPIGTLPWASTTERTIAAGPLRIYRVLGTAFLHSGNTLHPILPKSQCWCVDGESKFVLRIRQDDYYRIELPTQTAEHLIQVDKLKTVLGHVLQYEVTPCPFKRGFYVELPEPPTTPIIKRPWRPKSRPGSESPMPPDDIEGIEELGLQDVASPSTAYNNFGLNGKPAGPIQGKKIIESSVQSDDSSAESTDNENDSEATDDTDLIQKDVYDNMFDRPDTLATPTRPKPLRSGRAITAPPHLSLMTVPSDSATDPISVSQLAKETSSHSSSVDSFHSFHSPISPLPSSPSFLDHASPLAVLDADIDVPRTRSHKRDVSELTIRASSPEFWELGTVASGETTYHSPSGVPKTPTLVSDAASGDEEHWSEAITPSPTTEFRHRHVRPRRRTQSPLPSKSNLYAPYSPRSHMSGHHLTTEILQRTCSLLLGPPVQLVALMLRIAANIARGAYRRTSFGDGGQRIPCSWDFSDGSDDNDEDWEEDDYGFSLTRPTSSKEVQSREVSGSWEID